MGEFGAVSVVSGHVRGETNTLPLQVEILYNEYNQVGAFASSSVLALLAPLTLSAKALVEWRMRRESAAARSGAPEAGTPPLTCHTFRDITSRTSLLRLAIRDVWVPNLTTTLDPACREVTYGKVHSGNLLIVAVMHAIGNRYIVATSGTG